MQLVSVHIQWEVKKTPINSEHYDTTTVAPPLVYWKDPRGVRQTAAAGERRCARRELLSFRQQVNSLCVKRFGQAKQKEIKLQIVIFHQKTFVFHVSVKVLACTRHLL